MSTKNKFDHKYFEDYDSQPIGTAQKCEICQKTPFYLYYTSRDIFNINHCYNCNISDWKPRSYWSKLKRLIWLWLEN